MSYPSPQIKTHKHSLPSKPWLPSLLTRLPLHPPYPQCSPPSNWMWSPCVSLEGKLRQNCTWWRWVLVAHGASLISPSWPPVIEEANWMTLDKDVPQQPEGGFDAVICLGNSFAHLPDCKGERGCGLGHSPCFELYPLSTDPWAPALLSEQTMLFAPLPWHWHPWGVLRWEGDWCWEP